MRFWLVLAWAGIPGWMGGELRGNPLMAGADPHVMADGGEYWMYPTESGTRRPIFAAYRSKDLKRWERVGEVLDLERVGWVKEDGAPWHGAWAPAVLKLGKKYYFFYSVGPQNPTPSRIGLAVGERPQGPFRDSGKPLLTGGEGFEAIDPMAYRDPKSGKVYLFAGGSAGAKMRVFVMNAAMDGFEREVAVETPKRFTEAPFVHQEGGWYYLSYSHGRWNDASYSVHYARSRSIEGPWEYGGEILSSDRSRKGPGHHAVVREPQSGRWWVVYHRWETTQEEGPYRGSRQIAADRLEHGMGGVLKRVKMTGD